MLGCLAGKPDGKAFKTAARISGKRVRWAVSDAAAEARWWVVVVDADSLALLGFLIFDL